MKDFIQDKITILAEMQNLPKIMEWIRVHLRYTPFSSFEAMKIEIALEEVVVNIMQYAYLEERGNIEINFTYSFKEIVISIIDQGIPFNPIKNIPTNKVDLPLEEQQEGGLGLIFINKIMDEMHYERKHLYNVLILKKYCLESF